MIYFQPRTRVLHTRVAQRQGREPQRQCDEVLPPHWMTQEQANASVGLNRRGGVVARFGKRRLLRQHGLVDEQWLIVVAQDHTPFTAP